MTTFYWGGGGGERRGGRGRKGEGKGKRATEGGRIERPKPPALGKSGSLFELWFQHQEDSEDEKQVFYSK